MNNKILLAAAFVLIAPAFTWSAEIVLYDGKIITGKIVEENKEEIMMRLANNMFLKIEKTKVKRIVRDQKDDSSRPTVTMQTIKTSSASTPAAATTGQAAAPAAVVEKIALKNPVESTEASAGQTLHILPYSVSGKTFAEAQAAIFARDGGKGFMAPGGRMASKTEMESSWDAAVKSAGGQFRWEKIVVTATMTVTWPAWAAPKTASDMDVAAWNDFSAALQKHDEGHLDIYRSSLVLLKQQLENLAAPTEKDLRAASKTLYTEWLSRTDKQQSGHDRRSREKKPAVKK